MREPLAPVSHALQNAQIEITIDSNGCFIDAAAVPKKENRTLIPVSLKSANRTSHASPHPFAEQLEYLSGFDEERQKSYLEQLMDWDESAYAKKISIPATVKSKGITYKVTSIATKAVKNNKKVKSVVVGANVKKIANKAFFKCPNLKKITIKSVKFTKKNLNKKAFKGLHKKLVVKVPKKVYGLKEGILKEGLVK